MANNHKPRRGAPWKRAALSVITVGVAAAGSLAATGQANASANPAQGTGSPVSSRMQASGQLAQVATRASADAASLSPSTYAGVSMNVSTSTATIYVTKAPSSRMLASAAADATFGHVRYKVVKYTMASLRKAQKTLTGNARKLASSGIDITDWGPDPTTNTLHVGLIHPTSAAKAAVRAIVGVPVTFTAENSYPVKTATRLNDSPGFNGGDFMTDGNLVCTTGVPVVKNGNQYYLSVGHCFGYKTGDKMYNDDRIDTNNCLFTGCTYLGQSSHLDSATGYDDALMSGASYSDLDWENYTPYDPPTTLNGYRNAQQTYSTSVVGELVCPSGAYEGMVCNTKVLYVKESVFLGGLYLYYVDRAQNTSTIPVGGGDSGGPVFSTPPGHLNIEGIIEGRGDAIPCLNYPGRKSDCSYTIYYFDFATQAALWGVTLKTTS